LGSVRRDFPGPASPVLSGGCYGSGHARCEQAGFRLALIETLRALCITLTLGFALLVALRLVERLGGVIMPWADIAPGVFIVAIIGAIAWAFATRTRTLDAARTLDERADLRETLSTAICVQSDPKTRGPS
jgi:hypothetical protein